MNKKPKLKTRRPSPSKSQYNVLRKSYPKVSASKVAMTATVTMTTPVSVSTESVVVDSANDNESETIPRSPSSSSLLSSLSHLAPSLELSENGPLLVQKQKVRRKYSRRHNKTFHRRFLQVDCDEELINYFSCALLSDILLQGYLYISDNYFGFYSNIFGYKTKLLIPISEVTAVTREKTVKFIPNAVGIVTSEGKYVFGSLISRETTYRVMFDVWSKNIAICQLSPEKPKLRVSKSVDTVSELPITLTSVEAEDILCKIGESQVEKRVPKIILPDEAIAGYSSKTNSLKRRLSPLHKKYYRNDEISDTDSDLNSGDELLLKHSKFGAKIPVKTDSKNVRECFSLFLKNFSQRISSKSFLLSVILVILMLLVTSAIFMLYKVNLIHRYLSYFEPHKVSSKSFYSQEMQRINDELKNKLFELSQLMESLHSLLLSIDNITQSCLSSKSMEKPFLISKQCIVH